MKTFGEVGAFEQGFHGRRGSTEGCLFTDVQTSLFGTERFLLKRSPIDPRRAAGIIPAESPEALGIIPGRSPEPSGISRGSWLVSPLNAGIE
jgi:hypothetical protein